MNRTAENLNTVNNFLARRDVPLLDIDTADSDILVLMVSGLPEPLQVAANALKNDVVREILVSGGVGHSTQHFRDMVRTHPKYNSVETKGRPEAPIAFDILTRHLGVPAEQVLVEDQSTNCGENAEKSYELLAALGKTSHNLILVQDPIMAQRTHACFKRAWDDRDVWSDDILSFAPFIPVVEAEDEGYKITGSSEPVWSFDRLLSLTLGEIPRLRDDENGYGPNGRNFFDHVEIPDEVLLAHAELAAEFPSYVRPAGGF